MSWNETMQKHGLDQIKGNNNFVLEPRIGLCPLELWDIDTFSWEWKKPGMKVYKASHPGNQIVKVNVDFPVS